MTVIKNRIVEIFTTPILQDKDNNTLISRLCETLPPHIKIIGVEDKDREPKGANPKPSFLIVIGLSALSMGKVFSAFHTGEYERILVCDMDIHFFNVKGIIEDFLRECTTRGLKRIGTEEMSEISRRLDSVVMVRNGSDLAEIINSYDGQLNDALVKQRKKLLSDKELTTTSTLKEGVLKQASSSGAGAMMEALEGMI